jgi:hypothetical protein
MIQFSAKKMAFFSKANNMIKFLQKLAEVWAKSPNFIANFLGEKYFIIITSFPGMAKPLYSENNNCLL